MSEDTSRGFLFSTPDFKNREEERNHLYNRYTHMMTEEAIPPLPTREEELNYLDNLEKSFRQDPWITNHPKHYQASPFRLYWRYYSEMLREYRKTFLLNFFVSAGLSWPVIIYLANRRRYHKTTGVPVTYLRTNFFTPDYRLPDGLYNETSRRKFRWGVLKYTVLFGVIGAYLLTDDEYFKNDLNMRPDFNTERIMVTDDHIPIKERKVFDVLHGDYFGKPFDDWNNSLWKKTVNYFYPFNDYNPDRFYCAPMFDYKKDYVTQEFQNHYHFKI